MNSSSGLINDRRFFILLSSLKGFRNGFVEYVNHFSYGFKIRACHAVVMTFLFGRGTFLEKVRTILRLAVLHGKNLAVFALFYKIIRDLWRFIERNGRTQKSAMISAAFVGYFVFGRRNPVNTQINLYLLSRILYAMVQIGYRKVFSTKVVDTDGKGQFARDTNYFPAFAAFVWGTVLWLHEFYHDDLQIGLQHSMDYIYNDSNRWTSWTDLILVNKLSSGDAT